MKLTSCRSTCMARGLKTPQFKFNTLFSEHFPSNFLKKYFERKNWRGGDEPLLKNDPIDGYAY